LAEFLRLSLVLPNVPRPKRARPGSSETLGVGLLVR